MPGGPAYGQQQQFPPAFGGFMNDPTAQMGFQIGKSAVDAGQQYMEQNVRPGPFPSEALAGYYRASCLSLCWIYD